MRQESGPKDLVLATRETARARGSDPGGVAERLANFSRALRPIVGYLLLPNLVFAALARFNYAVRPLVNLDYIGLGLLAPFVGRATTVAMYAILLLLDLVATFAPAYHMHFAEALRSVGNLVHLNAQFAFPFTFLIIAVAVAFAVLATAASGAAREGVLIQRWVLVSLALVFAVADLVGGTNRYSFSRTAVVPINVATSAVARTVLAVKHTFLERRGTDRGGQKVRSATSPLLDSLLPGSVAPGDSTSPNVAVIIVESLGLFVSDSANAVLRSPFLGPQIRHRYTVNVGDVPFEGSTTSAEFRELCGMRMDFQEATPPALEACLPSYFASHGFHTVAIHGFTRMFFDRQRWYPMLGFQELIFAEDSALQETRKCGMVFRGVCDTDAGRLVADRLRAHGSHTKQFIYWLTLNSHLPVDEESAEGSTLDCATLSEGFRHNDVCILMRLLYLIDSTVARIAADPALPPTRFFIVGDHTPPFIVRSKRDLFVTGRVPFVELSPRVSKIISPRFSKIR